jgi:predicted transcriptional regulator
MMEERQVRHGTHELVEDAARAGERLVHAWSRLDDDERFELADQLTRRLQELRRRATGGPPTPRAATRRSGSLSKRCRSQPQHVANGGATCPP